MRLSRWPCSRVSVSRRTRELGDTAGGLQASPVTLSCVQQLTQPLPRGPGTGWPSKRGKESPRQVWARVPPRRSALSAALEPPGSHRPSEDQGLGHTVLRRNPAPRRCPAGPARSLTWKQTAARGSPSQGMGLGRRPRSRPDLSLPLASYAHLSCVPALQGCPPGAPSSVFLCHAVALL